MKKALCMLLVAMLIVSLLPISAAAADTPQYSVESKTVQVEDTFTMDVAIAQNPGIISLRFKVIYDQAVLELVSVENKGILNGFTTPAPTISSPYTLRWADSLATTNNEAQGVVVTLTFKALQTSSATTVEIEHGEARNANGTKETFANASATVVVKALPVAVVGVSLNKAALSLKTGESEQLEPVFSPENATNRNVTWSSSDKSVATVDSTGMVTAIKEGKTTITVTTEDGSFSANCVVTVECSHAKKVETPAKSADCVNAGNNQYYTCDACGAVFKADSITETTVDAETIPALHHDFSEKIEDTAHLVAGSGADCQHVKEYYYDCTRCDAIDTTVFKSSTYGEHKMANVWTTQGDEHFHKCTVSGCTYTEDNAACSGGTASCTEKAVCSVCNAPYGDFTMHDYKTEWSQGNASGHWHSCKNCSAHDAAIPHTPNVDAATEETAKFCTECGYVIEAQLGHTHKTTKVEGYNADCTIPGQSIYYTCPCGKWFGDSTANVEIIDRDSVIIPPLGHNWNEATCTAPKTCAACGATEGDALGHSWNDATCIAPKTCGVCGAIEGGSLGHTDADGDDVCNVCGGSAKPEPPSNPQTGDYAMPVLWTVVVIICIAVAVLLMEKKYSLPK